MTTEIPVTPATDIPRSWPDGVLSTLADRLGAHFTAAPIFGTPVERDGVTVVPVARLRFGFGGGGGRDPVSGQNGEGGGAGAIGTPIGYIELKGGETRFVRIVDPMRIVAWTVLGGALIARRRRGR